MKKVNPKYLNFITFHGPTARREFEFRIYAHHRKLCVSDCNHFCIYRDDKAGTIRGEFTIKI